MRPDNCEVTYWQVQAQWKGKNKDKDWFFHTYCDIVANKKFDHRTDAISDPSACGDCWQMFGDHGVLNEEAGIKWLELVRRESKLQQENSKDRIKLFGRDKYIPVRFRLAKIYHKKITEKVNI